MTEHSVTYFAALACLYSFFEFFLKRILWKPSGEHTGKVAALQAFALLLTLLIGTSGFSSIILATGSILVAVVYFSSTMFSKRNSAGRFALEHFLVKQALMGILLYALWRISLPITIHNWYAGCEEKVLGGLRESAEASWGRSGLILAIIAAYFFMIDGGTRIVRGILGKFPLLYQSKGAESTERGEQ